MCRKKGGSLVYNVGPANTQESIKESPIYELLPMEPKDEDGDDSGRLALCIVIDNSGSMSFRGLDKAAQSLIRSWDQMGNIELLSLFAFTSFAYWLTPEVPSAFSQEDILNKLDNLHAGGGGIHVQPAMEVAYESIRYAPFDRHVLLITDLDDSQTIGESAGMAAREKRMNKVTTHVLAIGQMGQFREELKELATRGEGTYKEISKMDNTLARVNWKGMGPKPDVYKDSLVRLESGEPSQIMNGLPKALPRARGYAPMVAKDGAVTPFLVKTKKDYAGMSHWLRDNGRVAMINAGIEHPEGWHKWDHVDKFWSQLLRWTINPRSANPYLERIDQAAGGFLIRYEPQTADAPTPASMEIQTTSDTWILPLQKTDDAQFAGRISTKAPGRHMISLLDEKGSII